MYAIRIPSLEDVPGFPVLIDGHHADNDVARYFVGGAALQRPSLTTVNGHIVAGFGSVSHYQSSSLATDDPFPLTTIIALFEIQLYWLPGQCEQDSRCRSSQVRTQASMQLTLYYLILTISKHFRHGVCSRSPFTAAS